MAEGINQSKNLERPRSPLTPEFIQRTKSVLGKFGDETKIRDFFVRSERVHGSGNRALRENHNLSINPPPEWVSFLESITPAEKAPLIYSMRQLIDAGYENFGQIRNAPVEEMANKMAGNRVIGNRRTGFIKSFFEAAKPE